MLIVWLANEWQITNGLKKDFHGQHIKPPTHKRTFINIQWHIHNNQLLAFVYQIHTHTWINITKTITFVHLLWFSGVCWLFFVVNFIGVSVAIVIVAVVIAVAVTFSSLICFFVFDFFFVCLTISCQCWLFLWTLYIRKSFITIRSS